MILSPNVSCLIDRSELGVINLAQRRRAKLGMEISQAENCAGSTDMLAGIIHSQTNLFSPQPGPALPCQYSDHIWFILICITKLLCMIFLS